MAQFVALPSWTWRGATFSGAEWLEGLVLTESSGNPEAVRYEPHQDRPDRTDRATDADEPGRDDGLLEDDRSYGLMQVMGSNVRRLCGIAPGVAVNFGFALRPLTNLSLGLRVLTAELAMTGGDVTRALARYNGGPTGDALDLAGHMRRVEYVDRVARNAAVAKADRDSLRASSPLQS